MWDKGKTFLFFLLFFLGWESVSRLVGNLQFILPPPTTIFHTLFEMKGRLLFHTLITLKEMGGGFAIAMALALPLAYLMFRFKSAAKTLQPFFIVIQSLPMFTLAPIMVIWFGWGYTAIVIPTALMIFLPLTLNIYQGLRQTPTELLEFFSLNGATERQTFFKLRFRYALPHLFAGLRIAAAVAGVGSVAGEWAGGQNGLGVLMLESRRNTELEITFAALFCLTALSLALYALVAVSERKMLAVGAKKKRQRNVHIGRKVAYVSVLALLLPLFFLGCRTKEPKTTRLLLDWLPNPNHVPIYVGIEMGFFKNQGIHLQIQKVHEAGHGISYLSSRQSELLISHMPETLKAFSKEVKISIVGCLIKRPLRGLTYLKDCSIKAPTDLTQKGMGYTLGETNAVFLETILERAKIFPSERRNVSFDLVSSLATGSIDFVFGGFWNIEPSQLKHLGVKTNTFPIEEFGIPNYYELIILAHSESSQARPEFVTSFSKALQQSIDFCKKNKEAAFALYLKNQKDLGKKGIAWEKEAWDITVPLLADSQDIDNECVTEFSSWLKQKKVIPEMLNKELLSSL